MIEKPDWKCAVVTPYFREDRAILQRCIRSVRQQTRKTDHFLVADGFAQDWVDREGVRHIRLDRCHGDYGNSPRSIGCLLAIAEQYDAIALLDADNWYDAHHVEHCLDTAHRAGEVCDYVIARRRLIRLDDSIMNVPDEPTELHVDTSCFFFLKGSFHTLPIWGLMPKELSMVCDRLFYSIVKNLRLIPAVSGDVTVNYQCLYEYAYRALGETPPPNAKPDIDVSRILAKNSKFRIVVVSTAPERAHELSKDC
jgi:hypothetical protein